MKRILTFLLASFLGLNLSAQVFTDASAFPVYGKVSEATKTRYQRLPAALIDRRIRAGYRIWPNNRIAFDLLNGTALGGYTPEEKAAFKAHIAAVPEALRPVLLHIYAGPLL